MIRSTSVLRYAAIGMATLALGGFAAASSASITGPTGPQSYNKASASTQASNQVNNNNNVGVGNLNEQGAASGDVKASDNTTVGGAMSGAATNGNQTSTSVILNNGSSAPSMDFGLGGGGTASLSGGLTTGTGPQSTNIVTQKDSFSNKVDNDNNVEVLNENVQGAESGNVTESDNTTAGAATSGGASNSNVTSSTVNISN